MVYILIAFALLTKCSTTSIKHFGATCESFTMADSFFIYLFILNLK